MVAQTSAPRPDVQVWRIHGLTRWAWTAVLLVVPIYAAVRLWETSNPVPAVIAPLALSLIAGAWAWLILWKPRATIEPDGLVVVNRLRRYRLSFHTPITLVPGTTFVTFKSGDRSRVVVTAMPIKYLFRRLLPWAHQHQARFVSAVEAAQTRFHEQQPF